MTLCTHSACHTIGQNCSGALYAWLSWAKGLARSLFTTVSAVSGKTGHNACTGCNDVYISNLTCCSALLCGAKCYTRYKPNLTYSCQTWCIPICRFLVLLCLHTFVHPYAHHYCQVMHKHPVHASCIHIRFLLLASAARIICSWYLFRTQTSLHTGARISAT